MDPSRLAGIPEVSEIPGAIEMDADWGLLPDDLGPAPGKNDVGDEASEAGYETGGIRPPTGGPELQRGCAEVYSIRQGSAGFPE